MKPLSSERAYEGKAELPLFEQPVSREIAKAIGGVKHGQLAREREGQSHGEQAHARRTDPATSHKAAASVSIVNLGRVKDGIIEILKDHGPQTDEYIAAVYAARVSKGMYPKHSPSGLRTRRSWLVDHGFVKAVGIGKTSAGRTCQIWSIA